MNILDENFPDDQRQRLQAWRIRVRKIGRDLGAKGMQDEQVIPLLQSIGRVTFFSLDIDFLNARLCHPAYSLVYLAVEDDEAASFVRRVLRHPALNTQAKRMGAVVRASDSGVRIWRRNESEQAIPWP
jgi:hypothetical protein